jgi:hypothetical protein
LGLLSFVMLALWQMDPVLAQPTTLAIGHPNNDVWNHIWGYGFVAESLLAGEFPLHTNLLNWPNGGTLWFIDMLGAVMTLPVHMVSGPVAAYNAGMLIQWVLCGVGMYALAWSVTGSVAGAWLAGVCYQSMPHLLGQAANGISETMMAGFLPLALLGLRSLFHRPSHRTALWAGFIFGLNALANWYYGLFAGIALLGLLFRALYRHPSLPSRRTLNWMGSFGLMTTLMVLPAFLAFTGSMSADDAVVTRDPQFVWATLVLHNMTDLVSFFRPGKHYSPDLKALFGEDLLVIVYLGHALLWPALFALLGRYRGQVRAWAGLGLVYFLLCLGPFLFVGGDYVSAFGGWIPLPFVALFKWFPMFSRISHAYRFSVGVGLVLCLLVAWTAKALTRHHRGGIALVGLIAILRLAESFYGSPAPFPLPVSDARVPEVVRSLSGGAVLDLPVGRPVLARSQYALAQLVHGQPSPYGLNDPLPRSLRNNRFLRFLVEMEYSTAATLPAQLPWFDLHMGLEAAVNDGLRWIVMHESAYPAGQFARTARLLDIVATPTHQGEGLRIYRLGPKEAGGD